MMFWEIRDAQAAASRNIAAGLTTGFIENFSAQADAFLAADRSISRKANLAEAYDTILADLNKERPRRKQFANPFSRTVNDSLYGESLRTQIGSDELEDRIFREISALRAERPDEFSHLPASKDALRELIREEVTEKVQRAEDIESRASGFGVIGGVAGKAGASLADPPNALTLGLGAPVRAGILSKLAIEAGIGSGVEATLQPDVQQYRKELGLKHGFDEVLDNVISAGMGAAGFTGATYLLGAFLKGGARAVEKIAGRRLHNDELDALRAAQREQEFLGDNPYVPGQRGSVDAHKENVSDALDAAKRYEHAKVRGREYEGKSLELDELPDVIQPRQVLPDNLIGKFYRRFIKGTASKAELEAVPLFEIRNVEPDALFEAARLSPAFRDAPGTFRISAVALKHAYESRVKGKVPEDRIEELFDNVSAVLREPDEVLPNIREGAEDTVLFAKRLSLKSGKSGVFSVVELNPDGSFLEIRTIAGPDKKSKTLNRARKLKDELFGRKAADGRAGQLGRSEGFPHPVGPKNEPHADTLIPDVPSAAGKDIAPNAPKNKGKQAPLPDPEPPEAGSVDGAEGIPNVRTQVPEELLNELEVPDPQGEGLVRAKDLLDQGEADARLDVETDACAKGE